MKRGNAGIVTLVMVGLAILLPVSAFAGGELADEDHDDSDKASGPYGFVKDTRGVAIPEATVTAEIKNRGPIIAHTNILGAYRIPGFGIDINPDDVTIACKKDGYKQLRVVRRQESPDGKAAVEIECTLERQ